MALCSPQSPVERIARGMAMQVLTGSAERRLHIQRLTELPPLPFTSAKLLQILSGSYDRVDIGELTDLIKLCPGLSARIVGLANTAYFHGNRKVYTVSEGIVRIGLNMAKGLTLGLLLAAPFQPPKSAHFNPQRHWYEAILTATAAALTAGFVHPERRPLKEEAYLAGLLHNLGLLVLARTFPEEMDRVFAHQSCESDLTLVQRERAMLCVDHHQAGGWVLRKWHLPERLVTVVERTHDPAYRGEHWQLVLLVGFCARWMAQRFEALDLRDLESGTLAALGLTEKDVDRLATTCQQQAEKLTELADVMGGGAVSA